MTVENGPSKGNPQPKREVKFPTSETRRLATQLFPQLKSLIDKKFPLVEAQVMGDKEFVNQALVDGDTINFLYLPEDESRNDPEEQLKVSSTKDNITVIIKNDRLNPEISFQTFDATSEFVLPKMLSYIKNSPEAARKVREVLDKLKGLKGFDLVYPPKAA